MPLNKETKPDQTKQNLDIKKKNRVLIFSIGRYSAVDRLAQDNLLNFILPQICS